MGLVCNGFWAENIRRTLFFLHNPLFYFICVIVNVNSPPMCRPVEFAFVVILISCEEQLYSSVLVPCLTPEYG